MPVVPPLILLAVWAVFRGVDALRRGQWKPVAGGLAVLVPAAVLVNVTPHAEVLEGDFVSHVMLGDVYDDHGRPDLATENYREALAVAPGDLTAAYGLGSALTKLNRLPEGVEAFRRVLTGPRVPRAGETDAMMASVHSNLANALAQTGVYGEAIEHYRAAIELNPAGGQGSDQFNLGLVLGSLGRNDEAMQAFEEALAVNADFYQARHHLARLLVQQGRLDAAAEHLWAALDTHPGDPQIRQELGAVLTHLGRHEEAAELHLRGASDATAGESPAP
jgi:tetratricopeptide (TPR) repeat protein